MFRTTLAIMVGLIALAGCAVPSGESRTLARQPGLTLVIQDKLNTRTLLPSASMVAADFLVTGLGPNGESFQATTTEGSLSRSGLSEGLWSLIVTARNAAGFPIGRGQTEAVLSSLQSTVLTVTVTPLPGNGTLQVTVYWNSQGLAHPSLEGTLTPVLGEPLPITLQTNTELSANEQIILQSLPAGYYTLALQLKDGAKKVAGSVETVRIAEGTTTTGTYNFDSIIAEGGFASGIVFQSNDPLELLVTGDGMVPVGGGTTFKASVAHFEGNASYVWYLDGEAVATGSEYRFQSPPSVRRYRVDVLAFSVDGTRAGSTTVFVDVGPLGPH